MLIKPFLILLVFLVSPLTASQAAVDEELLQNYLRDLSTLKADFQQVIEIPDEGSISLTHGTFYLKRPGRLRWEYAEPNKQLIVADGRRIWLYDYELEQISHRSQSAALDGTPAQLLSDSGPLEQHFEIIPRGEEDGIEWVELRPNDKEAQFISIRIGFLDDQMQRLEMSDTFGQVTRFIFSNILRNPKLNPELFVFKPPSGIDLIGDL